MEQMLLLSGLDLARDVGVDTGAKQKKTSVALW